jgi:hypothetical protein
MSQLLYAKICMVITIGFAGLNIHQFMSPYDYVQKKIREFREFVSSEGNVSRINTVSFLIYFFFPAAYLFILFKAGFFTQGLFVLITKFAISAGLGLWTQKKVLADSGYSRRLHWLGKFDNFFNIVIAAGVAYLLIFPLQK